MTGFTLQSTSLFGHKKKNLKSSIKTNFDKKWNIHFYKKGEAEKGTV